MQCQPMPRKPLAIMLCDFYSNVITSFPEVFGIRMARMARMAKVTQSPSIIFHF